MDIKQITIAEVHAKKVQELGLDPTCVDLTSTEAIACSIRRVAGFLCPCARSTIIRAVIRPLQGLLEQPIDEVKETVERTLEAVITHGDLIEQYDISGNFGDGSSVLIYAAPPCFILRQSGMAIVLGVSPDQFSILPKELKERVEYINYVRRLLPQPEENLRTVLIQLGFIELSLDSWIKQPQIESSVHYVSYMNGLLDSAIPSGEISELLILDTTKQVRYYRGRWVKPTTQTGRFIARRVQAYGSDLWCYIELNKGNPVKFVDFPLEKSIHRGCDEALLLQMAIDHETGIPQVFGTQKGPKGTSFVNFYSPIPMWAKKRLDSLGEPVELSGSLFSYKIDSEEMEEEIFFLKNKLWLSEVRQ